MKKTLLAALSGAAFFYAMGIVGAVEQGAPVARMLWTIPLLALGAWSARRCINAKRTENREKRKYSDMKVSIRRLR